MPEASEGAWEATYAASGSFSWTSSDGITQSFDVPPTFSAAWASPLSDRPPRFALSAHVDRARVLALQFSVIDRHRLARLDVTVPTPKGTLTVSVLPDSGPLEWLFAAPGSEQSASTNQGRYVATLTRQDASRWQLRVEPKPGGQAPYPELTSADLTFAVSSPQPPWDRIDIRIHAVSTQATLDGRVSLVRRAVPGSP